MSTPSPLWDVGRRFTTLLATQPGAGDRRPWFLLAAVWAGCTLLLLLFRPGYLFPPYGGLDGWIYTAYQWDLRNQIADFGPTYYGSRLSWILPGALLHSLLPFLAAEMTYKLIVSACFAIASATLIYRTFGLGAAVLAVALSVLCPQFIVALHTDYIDTAVIVYAALTLACITGAKDSRRWPMLIFLGGCFYTGMVIANLSALSSLGAGVAVYHLFWLRWGIRRQITCVGLYLAAAAVTCTALGLVHRAVGGPFLFLKPQIDMLSFMRGLKENPWIPKDPLWFTEATWLLMSAGALLWGLYCSLIAPPTDDRKRLLTRSLTASLATSFFLAAYLQARGLNATLSASFYASFHVCLALPLLVACVTSSTRPSPISTRWLLATLTFLPVIVLAWDPRPATKAMFNVLPFLHSSRAVPLLVTVLLLLASSLTALVARRFKGGLFPALMRPELLLMGIFGCSVSIDFHDVSMTDRLRERYALVHAAYRVLAHELPIGSYRFWVPADELDGVSLASTKLWGYRLFSLKRFPEFEGNNLAAVSERQTLVVPSAPGRSSEVLAIATRVLRAAGYVLTAQRNISVPGDAGLGFDLVCFSIHQPPIDPETAGSKTLPNDMLMDLKFFSAETYLHVLGQNLYGPKKKDTIDTSKGYPIFTRTDPRDHLATAFQPLGAVRPGASRQLSVIVTMPAEGDCVGVFQIQDCVTVAQIAWSRKGRFVHTITIPAGSTSLRLYLQSNTDLPTALPTRITVYDLHPTATIP